MKDMWCPQIESFKQILHALGQVIFCEKQLSDSYVIAIRFVIVGHKSRNLSVVEWLKHYMRDQWQRGRETLTVFVCYLSLRATKATTARFMRFTRLAEILIVQRTFAILKGMCIH